MRKWSPASGLLDEFFFAKCRYRKRKQQTQKEPQQNDEVFHGRSTYYIETYLVDQAPGTGFGGFSGDEFTHDDAPNGLGTSFPIFRESVPGWDKY